MENKEESNETFNNRSLRVMERMGNEVQMLTESIREMTNKQDQMVSQQRENVDAIQHFAVSMTNVLEKTLCSGDSPRQTQSEDSRPQSQFWGNQTRRSTSPLRGRLGDSRWSPYEYNQDMEGFGGGAASYLGFDSRGDSPWLTQRPYTSTTRRDSYCPPFNPFDSSYRRSFERGKKHEIPHQKLPTFDGTGDWDGFMLPFKRASKRYQWSDEEKLDRFVECFRGHASKFITTLPLSVQDNFDRLAKMMEDRFNMKDPPTTARKRLEDLRQKGETDDEFAEEARRLVARAFPTVTLTLQEELAAEAFLKGYRNSRVGYEALNKAPKTISEALDIVVQLQHNYKATVGRETEMRRSSRRVSWEDEYLHAGEPKSGILLSKSHNSEQKTLQDEIKELRELFLSNLEAKGRQRSPSPSKGCFKCGDKSHFQRDCPTNKQANTECYYCGDPEHFKKDCPLKKRNDKLYKEQNHSIDEGNDTTVKPVLQIGKKTGGRSISVLVKINDVEAEAIVDTGADVSVLSRKFARHLRLELDNKHTTHLMNAEDGKEMEAVCDVKVKLLIGNSTTDWSMYICPTRENVLIGMDLLEALDAVVRARQGDLVINGIAVAGRRKTDYNVGGHSASNPRTAEASLQLTEYGGEKVCGHSAPDIDMTSLEGRYSTEVNKGIQLKEPHLGILVVHKWLKGDFQEFNKSLFSSRQIALQRERFNGAHDSPFAGNPALMCAISQKPTHITRAQMLEYHAGAPPDKILQHILGPIPNLTRGSKHIPVLVDKFLNWNVEDTTGYRPKLQLLWKAPDVVDIRRCQVLYEVQDKNKTDILPHGILKVYFMEAIPLWFNRFRHSLKDEEDRVWTQCPTIAETNEDIPATEEDTGQFPGVIVAHASSSMDTDPTQDMQQETDSGKQFPGLSRATGTAIAAESTNTKTLPLGQWMPRKAIPRRNRIRKKEFVPLDRQCSEEVHVPGLQEKRG